MPRRIRAARAGSGLLTTIAQLAALAAFARFGVRWARESAAGRMGTGMLLGMLGFALVWAVQLPFAVLEVWWARHNALEGTSYLEATLGHWLALGGTVRLPLSGARDRDGFRGAARRLVVATRCPVLHRAGRCSSHSSRRTSLLGSSLADPDLRAATARLERIEHVRTFR